jgi:hypothetical protein
MRQILPIVIFIHLNPTLEVQDFIDSPLLNGFISWTEASSTFLSQTIADLDSYQLLLISPTFTDVAKGLLRTYFENKLKYFSQKILI